MQSIELCIYYEKNDQSNCVSIMRRTKIFFSGSCTVGSVFRLGQNRHYLQHLWLEISFQLIMERHTNNITLYRSDSSRACVLINWQKSLLWRVFPYYYNKYFSSMIVQSEITIVVLSADFNVNWYAICMVYTIKYVVKYTSIIKYVVKYTSQL